MANKAPREAQPSGELHLLCEAVAAGLLTPEEARWALEERARLANAGKQISATELLLRSGRLTRAAAEALGATRRGVGRPAPVAPARAALTAATPAGSGTARHGTTIVRPRRGAPARPTHAREHFPPADARPRSIAKPPIRAIAKPPIAQLTSPVTPPTSPPPTSTGTPVGPGRRLGPYTLLEEIGRGGMGVIFKARREPGDGTVAVKVLGEPGRPSLVERFARETRAASRLVHPHIVRILEAGFDAHLPWYAMELVEGAPLSSVLARRALPLRQGVALLRDVARAVHFAHEHGVLHRDLKPANVLLAPDGTPRVTDFGLAKLEGDAQKLTRAGAPLGTPAYMSPEQVEGRAVDRRTDVFALGIMLHELANGGLPWIGETADAIQARRVAERVPRLQVGEPALERVVARACERDRRDRYDTAEALARDLDAWLSGAAVDARAPSTLRRLARRSRRGLELAGAGLGGAVAVLLVTGFCFDRAPRPGSAAEPRAVAVPEKLAPTPLAASVASPPSPARAPAALSSSNDALAFALGVRLGAARSALVPAAERPADATPGGARAPSCADSRPARDGTPEAELARVRAGRALIERGVVGLAVDLAPGVAGRVEALDDSALALVVRAPSGQVVKLSLAKLPAARLAHALAAPADRAPVAAYLRARGLGPLATALEHRGVVLR